MGLYCSLYLQNAPTGIEYAPDERVQLGRSWDALNFLLTGQRESDGTPASLLVEDFPDIGGGEAVMIDAGAVAAFSQWLAGQSDDALLSRFDPKAMATAGVYDADILEAHPAASLEELRQGLQSLRILVKRGSELGGGIIRVIC